MLTHTQMNLQKALLSAAAGLLLLTTAAQSAVLTTETTPLSNSSLTTQLSNSSMDGPLVLRSHTPCGSEGNAFCANGGKCVYPQDSETPSCICTSSFSGARCMLIIDSAHSPPQVEKVIGICFGIIMVLILLAIVVYCCARNKCKKSKQLIKSAPSETSV